MCFPITNNSFEHEIYGLENLNFVTAKQEILIISGQKNNDSWAFVLGLEVGTVNS